MNKEPDKSRDKMMKNMTRGILLLMIGLAIAMTLIKLRLI